MIEASSSIRVLAADVAYLTSIRADLTTDQLRSACSSPCQSVAGDAENLNLVGVRKSIGFAAGPLQAGGVPHQPPRYACLIRSFASRFAPVSASTTRPVSST